MPESPTILPPTLTLPLDTLLKSGQIRYFQDQLVQSFEICVAKGNCAHGLLLVERYKHQFKWMEIEYYEWIFLILQNNHAGLEERREGSLWNYLEHSPLTYLERMVQTIQNSFHDLANSITLRMVQLLYWARQFEQWEHIPTARVKKFLETYIEILCLQPHLLTVHWIALRVFQRLGATTEAQMVLNVLAQMATLKRIEKPTRKALMARLTQEQARSAWFNPQTSPQWWQNLEEDDASTENQTRAAHQLVAQIRFAIALKNSAMALHAMEELRLIDPFHEIFDIYDEELVSTLQDSLSAVHTTAMLHTAGQEAPTAELKQTEHLVLYELQDEFDTQSLLLLIELGLYQECNHKIETLLMAKGPRLTTSEIINLYYLKIHNAIALSQWTLAQDWIGYLMAALPLTPSEKKAMSLFLYRIEMARERQNR